MPPRSKKRPAAAEGEPESKKKQRKQTHVHPLVPAWTHAALNSGSALAGVYAEIRKNIGVPQGRVIRVATALPNTLSPMPTVMEVMPEAHYALAATYSKSHAGFALLGKKHTADHIYVNLPSIPCCVKHASYSCNPGTADIMLSSSECSQGILDEVEPSLVPSSLNIQSNIVVSS